MANRIGDTAVLEYRPIETLAFLSAILLELARLCRPCRLASSPHWRKPGLFQGTNAKSGERRTVCWREVDSNFRFRIARCLRAREIAFDPAPSTAAPGIGPAMAARIASLVAWTCHRLWSELGEDRASVLIAQAGQNGDPGVPGIWGMSVEGREPR